MKELKIVEGGPPKVAELENCGFTHFANMMHMNSGAAVLVNTATETAVVVLKFEK